MMKEVSKCPACGALRHSFTAVCPDCGHEFTDISTSRSLSEFTSKIEGYDLAMAQNAGSSDYGGIGLGKILLWIFIFPLMLMIFIVRCLIAILNKIKLRHLPFTGIEKAKSDAIRNYPIPASRKDLMEYALFIDDQVAPVSFIDSTTRHGINTQRWNRIWASKAAQVEKKARISLMDDPQALRLVCELCQSAVTKYQKNEKTMWIGLIVLVVTFIVCAVGTYIFLSNI